MVIGVFGLCSDVFSIGDYTTGQWKTSGRLVQELNVCTTHVHTDPNKETEIKTSRITANILSTTRNSITPSNLHKKGSSTEVVTVEIR